MLCPWSGAASAGDASAASHPGQGAEGWTFPLSCSPPASCWGQNPGYPMRENTAFFSFPSPFFSKYSANLNTSFFFTMGELLTCQHQFLASLQNLNPGKVQPICWFPTIFSLPKAQSLPKKLLQLHSSQLAGTCPHTQEHMAAMPRGCSVSTKAGALAAATRAGLLWGSPAPHTSTAPSFPAFAIRFASLWVYMLGWSSSAVVSESCAREHGGDGGS